MGDQKTGHWRELAGILASLIVIVAFVSIGFIVMFSKMKGVEIAAPGDWTAAMLSLCSAAVGYLIGKQSSSSAPSSLSNVALAAQSPVVVQRTQEETVQVSTPAATTDQEPKP